jgi:hypothetical protein
MFTTRKIEQIALNLTITRDKQAICSNFLYFSAKFSYLLFDVEANS